jgi:hypothetical protein
MRDFSNRSRTNEWNSIHPVRWAKRIVQKKISHVKFQQGIVSGLIGNFREGNKRRGRKSSIIHLPVGHHNQHHYVDIILEGRNNLRLLF